MMYSKNNSMLYKLYYFRYGYSHNLVPLIFKLGNMNTKYYCRSSTHIACYI